MSDSITFGTDGWRAIIAEQFTFANVERVAYATGQYVKETYYKNGKKPPMLVGYDTRFLADRFAKRVAEVLIGMGIEAKISARDVPTPVIAWATQLEETAGALQLTASHNPPEYCGMKYIPEFAGPATNEITNKIAAHLNDLPAGYECKSADVATFDAHDGYLEAIKKRVDWKKIQQSKLRIVCDTIYSTSRGYLDTLVSEAGLETKALHNWRDPLFGGGMPEPKPEYLTELIEVMKGGQYDLGCATDGDADRFGIVDNTGTYFSPNQLMCLLTRHLVKNHGMKGTIVRTVATTHMLDKLGEMYGLDIIETPVGFKYIGEMMRLKDVLIGGEESGGLSVKGHIPEKDGILANLLIIEMLAFEKKPLGEVWADLQNEANLHLTYKRRDMQLSPMTHRGLMEALTSAPFEKIGQVKVEKVGRADGLKFYIDSQNWVLVRPSGTEPLIRLYFEGTSEEKVTQTLNDFVAQVNAIVDDLNKKYGSTVKQAVH